MAETRSCGRVMRSSCVPCASAWRVNFELIHSQRLPNSLRGNEMVSQGSAWYVDFFRGDYLNVYGHIFTEERAEKESAFVASVLELKPGSSVLDLCCGQGRHSVELAKR